MANRLLKYSSKSEYDAAKDSLPIPYVATYPSETDGKTVVVYANVDGTNQSEVIATAQLTELIAAVQADMEINTAEITALIEDMQAAAQLTANDHASLPLLCGQPMTLFGAGTPQEAIVPSNWKQFDPVTGTGYNWNGTPSAEGQVYINTLADVNGRYTAIRSGHELVWKNF